MIKKRRSPSQFNLSFLDIMCCGFGAVVLLVMILSGEILSARQELFSELESDVIRLQREVSASREQLDALHTNLSDTGDKLVHAQDQALFLASRLDHAQTELSKVSLQKQFYRESINSLQGDLLKLDAENQRLAAERQADLTSGQQVREFIGSGDRQYLTGLRLGGKRTLILLDASASMLDETILNIIIRRNLDERARRASPKWQRALKTVDWLAANLPFDSALQIYFFNTDARPATREAEEWVAVKDQSRVSLVLAALKKIVPQNGTSLQNAFAAAARISPRPDNIILLTDGLPTQSDRPPSGTTVSGEERLALFQKAVVNLPKSVPVNIILFPMEGDPMAAVSYWELALNTKGSFLTPTRDWP